MGSLGWARCYWCGAWVWNPYVLESIGNNVLCDTHWDYAFPGQGPMRRICPIQPNGRTRVAASLLANVGRRHQICDTHVVAATIAEFLVAGWAR